MIKFEGLVEGMKKLSKELQEELESDAKLTHEAIHAAINDEVFVPSQKRVPVNTTTLQRSGDFFYETKGDSVTWTVRYGGKVVDGEYVDYAAAVHEMPNDVNWTKEGTGNKYIEIFMEKLKRNFFQMVKKKRDALRGGL